MVWNKATLDAMASLASILPRTYNHIARKFGGELIWHFGHLSYLCNCQINISYLYGDPLLELPNLNLPIIFQWQFWVQPPNLILANVSSYMVCAPHPPSQVLWVHLSHVREFYGLVGTSSGGTSHLCSCYITWHNPPTSSSALNTLQCTHTGEDTCKPHAVRQCHVTASSY